MRLPTSRDLHQWGRVWYEVGRKVWVEWREDRASGVAAEIAFWLILTIFPVLIMLGSILGSLEAVLGRDLTQKAEDQVVEWIGDLLGSQSGPATDVATDLFNGRGAGTLTFTTLIVLYTASRVLQPS